MTYQPGSFMRLNAGQMLLPIAASGLLVSLLRCAGASVSPEVPKEVSFCNEVMAVLSKAGCSAGTCHGNKNGKGGFKLSLRGQDPEVDYLTLTRDLFALRVNSLEPEKSMILLKPTTQLAHDGGLRFKKESEEYQI